MNKQQLQAALMLSEQKIGLAQTLHCFYGANVKVSIGYTASAISGSVDELCFSVRSQNALKRASIFTVGEVINALNQEQIEKIRNLGRKSISEIKTRILKFGVDQLSDGEKAQFFSKLIDLNPEKTAEICASAEG